MLDLNSKVQVGTPPGPRELRRSSAEFFWIYFIIKSLAGQPTAEVTRNTFPDSPSHPLLFLGGARGSDWGHILRLLNTCDGVMGAVVIAGVTAAFGVPGAAGVTGEAGSPGIAAVGSAADVTGASGVTGLAGATGVICVAGPSGVLGA